MLGFGAVGSFVGRMFGSEKAVEKGIDMVSNGFDKLIYTNEEKAEDAAKNRSEARGMLVEWIKTSQGHNVARRFLAIVISMTWLLMYILSAALDVSAVWLVSKADQLNTSSMLIGDRAEQMNGAMMLILGFYFAAPHMSGIVTAAMEKFSGKAPAKDK
jgi:hypothetical protein